MADLNLGTAANYAILAGAGITNTGLTVVTGGVIGSSPTATETGWNPPGVATIDNTHAAAAVADGLTAYNAGVALTFTSLSASSANLSTLGNGATASTYTPGNYSAGTSMDIPTSITLDAQGNPNAVFIFKAGSTLTLESAASILLVNGAQAQHVYWLVGTSMTQVGDNNVMVGNILANTSITLDGGSLAGRALAGLVTSSGAVTIAAAEAINVPVSLPEGQADMLLTLNPFPAGIDNTQHLIYVRGVAKPSVTLYKQGGLTLNWFQLKTVSSGTSFTGEPIKVQGKYVLPIQVNFFSVGAGNYQNGVYTVVTGGYEYVYNLTNNTFQIFAASGGTATTGPVSVEMPNQSPIPAAVLNDVIQFEAVFVRSYS
jgi:hypothetical protein